MTAPQTAAMRTWFKFSAQAAETDSVELSIFDYIGYFGVTARDFALALSEITASKLKVSINSPGGDVFEAIGIYNVLRASGKEITTEVLGIAASAASYIYLAGDKRVMPSNAMQMVHNASTGLYGNADELTEAASILRKIDQNLQATYADRTGLSAEKVVELLSKDTFLTAAECLEFGLCDEVVPAVKATAAFDLERLPENVRAVFEAAAEDVDGDDIDDAAQEAADREALAAEAALAAAPTRPTVETFKAKLDAAGLGAYLAVFVADDKLANDAAIDAALADAKEIVSLCSIFERPTYAAGYIASRISAAEARTRILQVRADADAATHIDSTQPLKKPAANSQAPQPVTTEGIWAKTRTQTRR